MLNILNNSLLFLSGIFISIETFPTWLQYVSHMSLITLVMEFIKTCDYEGKFNYLSLGSGIFLICKKKQKLKVV